MAKSVEGTSLLIKLRHGDSFIEEFNKRIEPWKDIIQVHAEDLSQSEWHGDKIEFLLIDAMKSWTLTNNIISGFFPALIPGSGLILHQDFAHWYTSWIHLAQYRMRDYFEPVYDVPRSSSFVFRLRGSIPPEILRNQLSFSSFTRQEIDAAFDYSLSLVSRDKQPNIAAAKVMVFLHVQDFTQARRELEYFRSKGLTFSSELAFVEQRLISESRTLETEQSNVEGSQKE